MDFWAHVQGVPSAARKPSKTYSFPYSTPSDSKWGESWAMHRISAGYTWGRGVSGRPDFAKRRPGTETRVCLIGAWQPGSLHTYRCVGPSRGAGWLL